MKKVHIVLPCFNPEVFWEKSLCINLNLLENELKGYQIETTLVLDGTIILETQENYIKENVSTQIEVLKFFTNRGKGASIRSGFKNSTADFYFFTDIDFPYTLDNFKRMIEVLENGSDIVIGHRNVNHIKKHQTVYRKWISKLLKLIVSFFFKLSINDTQSGLKGFTNKGKNILFKTKINRYLFDLELLVLASKEKLIIHSIPIELRPHIKMPNMRFGIIVQEFFNFFQIWYDVNFRK